MLQAAFGFRPSFASTKDLAALLDHVGVHYVKTWSGEGKTPQRNACEKCVTWSPNGDEQTPEQVIWRPVAAKRGGFGQSGED